MKKHSQEDQGDQVYQEILYDPLCRCCLVHQVHLYHHEDLEDPLRVGLQLKKYIKK